MANTTDKELIEMYQDQLEKASLEISRLEKSLKELKKNNSKPLTEENQNSITLEARLKALKDANTKQEDKDTLILELEQMVRGLFKEVCYLRRKFWGKSSERYIPQEPGQRKIEFEGLEMTPEETELLQEAVKTVNEYKGRPSKIKEKAQPKRKKLPENLKRVEIELPDPEEVNETDWICLGTKKTEVLAYKPAEIYIKVFLRRVWVRKSSAAAMAASIDRDDINDIRKTPYPNIPIKKSNADASILSALLVGKYVDHQPFYRQLEIFKRNGISLSSSTVNDWFIYTCDMLRALYTRLQELVVGSKYIQVDESTIPVVNKEKSRAVKGYIWMVRDIIDNRLFFFYDHGSRAQKVALGLLDGYQGTLQTDGYAAYDVFEKIDGILLLGCWAHARRWYDNALKEDKVRAEYALTQIGMLYDIERMADEQNLTHEQRAKLRTEKSYPILVAFEKWVYKNLLELEGGPKGNIYKALMYTYRNFYRLSRYHLDGGYKIDNNMAENSIRPLALGRKNYLFCQNDDAAENTAMMYSFFGCCKALNVNPYEWLTWVLSQITRYNQDYSLDLADLLPHNWIKNYQNN